MALSLTLNGQARRFEELADGASVQAVLEALGLKADRVAVELRGEIVPRRLWTEMPVGDGDKLEVVHFVGGGATA